MACVIIMCTLNQPKEDHMEVNSFLEIADEVIKYYHHLASNGLPNDLCIELASGFQDVLLDNLLGAVEYED